MSRKVLLFWIVALMGMALSACRGPAPAPSTQQAEATFVSATATPPAQATPAPAASPSPAPTPTPPFTLPGVGTPLPETLAPISPANAEQLTLIAQWGKGMAGKAAWTPDGHYVAVPSGLGVYFYDAQTFQEARYLPVVSWGDYADASATEELAMGTPIPAKAEVAFADANATLVAFSPDGRWMAVGFADGIGKVRLVALESGQPVAVVDMPSPTSLAFSPDSRFLAVGAKGVVAVWDVSQEDFSAGAWYAWLEGANQDNSEPIGDLAFSPDGRWLAAATESGKRGYLWRFEAGKHSPAQTFEEADGSGGAYSVAFSPDSTKVFFGGQGGQLRGWNLADDQAWPMQDTGGQDVTALAFSPQGTLWLGRLPGDVVVWDLDAQQAVATWQDDPGLRKVVRLAPSPDGSLLVVQKEGSLLEIWDAAAGKPLGSIQAHWGPVLDATDYAPEASLLALAVQNTVILVNATTGEEVQRLTNSAYDVEDVALSPDGQWLAVSSEDGALKVWSLSEGKVRHVLKQSSAQPYFTNVAVVAFSPTGQYVASVGYQDNTIALWDPTTGQQVRTLHNAPEGSQFLTFGPAGDYLLALSNEESLARVWEVATDKIVAEFSFSPEASEGLMPVVLTPLAARFSPDGQRLVVIGAGLPPLVAFTMESGDMLWFGEAVGSSLAFSPDGQLLVGGENAVVMDGMSGEALSLLSTAPIAGAYFSADGTRLYLIGSDGVVRVWGVSPET